MDPRIRRRRVEVRRQEGRRRLRVLVGLTAVTAVGLGGWAATDSRLLDLDRVVVVGAANTAAGEVELASGLRRGQRLLDIDPEAAVRAVEALPWVQSAAMSTHWPGEVRIRLVERQPVAFTVSQGGNAALVDGGGRVLSWADVPPSGLAPLAGLAPAGPAGTALAPEDLAVLRVAVALPVELRSRTAGVAPAGGRGEVQLHLSAQGVIRLGPPQDLDRKFTAVRAVLAQVDVGNVAVLDVRRPETPVLTRLPTPVKVSTPRVG